jgi:hypothetical protein
MPGESPMSMMRSAPARSRKPAPKRKRRWPILVPVAIVVTLALAWSWLWYYSATVADRTLSGWVEREAAAGRFYACGTQSIGGFPVSIQAHCTDAVADIKTYQPTYGVRAHAIDFLAEVYHPTRLIGDVSSPISIAVGDQPPTLTANWKRARVIVGGVPPDPDTVSFELDAARLDHAGSNDSIAKVARGDLQGRVISGSARNNPIIEVKLRLKDAAAPTLHQALAQPMSAEADAVLRGFKDLGPKPWADRFREMQASGGGIEIKALRLTQGDAAVLGAGSLTINANGKLDGVIHIAVANIERIVPLIGVDQMISQGVDHFSGSEGTLDRLLPGLGNVIRDTANASLIDNLKKMGQPTSIDDRPAILLPLRFVDSSVYLGLLRVGELPPLF